MIRLPRYTLSFANSVDDYPDEETLKKIREFDFGDKLQNSPDFFRLIYDNWLYHDTCWRYDIEKDCLQISTGGWSGNEDIIEAMKDNFQFWLFFWYQARAGGHYWFMCRGLYPEELKEVKE